MEAARPIFYAIVSFNWLELIKTLAAVATVVIAYRALMNWKRQDKAKREAEFLDELIETTHTYIEKMWGPVALLGFAKIGMASHVRDWEEGKETEKAIEGAIAYIKKNGEQDGKRLSVALGEAEPSVIRLRSLATKGQVFKFDGYLECRNAVALLTRNYDRVRGFNSLIQTPTYNWQHPEVLELLMAMIGIEPNEIQKSISDANVALIEFVGATYTKSYG